MAAHPSAYLGKTVTVSGRVGEVLGEKAFTLESRGPYQEQLLAAGVALSGSGARFMEVTGEVRRFDRAAFERETGTRLDANAVREWTGRPALLVKSLKVVEPARRTSPSRDS